MFYSCVFLVVFPVKTGACPTLFCDVLFLAASPKPTSVIELPRTPSDTHSTDTAASCSIGCWEFCCAKCGIRVGVSVTLQKELVFQLQNVALAHQLLCYSVGISDAKNYICVDTSVTGDFSNFMEVPKHL